MHRISDYLYLKTCCRVFCSTAVAAFLLFGCEKPYTDLETSTKHHSSHIGDKKGTDSLNTQREMFLFKMILPLFMLPVWNSIRFNMIILEGYINLYTGVFCLTDYQQGAKLYSYVVTLCLMDGGVVSVVYASIILVRKDMKRILSTLFGGVEVLLHLSEHAHNTLLNLFVHNALHRKSRVTR